VIYPAYSDYRLSGVEWLDIAPTHWTSVAIKYMALDRGSLFLDGDWIESKDISGDEIRYITTGNVGEGHYKEQGLGFITEEKFKQLNCTEVFEGDILISRLNAPIGRSCIIPDLNSRIVTSVDNVIFRPDSKYYKQFIVHCFSSKDYFKHTSNLARGATMQRISRGLFGNIRVVIPPYEEQEKIANFLDYETAKIDTLIEKQQLLIKLLKEKRQAVISHAVTKGLNPIAPMRDSGVEWLGEVPAHWSIPKIKWFYETESGGTPNTSNFEEYYQDGDIPWIRTTDLNNGDLYETPVTITDKAVADSACSILPISSVLVAMYGGAGTIGKHSLLKFESTINQAVCAILPIDKIDPEYMHLYVEFYRPYWMVGAEGTRKDPNINQEVVRELMIPCPPSNEQIDIVKATKKKLSVIDEIVSKSESNIQLMQERRTSLISAAVTGKIDVRLFNSEDRQAPATSKSEETAA
jgi:type I restriction enzyme S subunit